MLEIKYKSFLFTQNDHEAVLFYYEPNIGLCTKTLSKLNIWSYKKVIIKDIYPYFHIEVDKYLTYHLFYQDSKGHLHYSKIKNSNITTTKILESQKTSSYNKHLMFTFIDDLIYFFYILKTSSGSILVSQLYDNNYLHDPIVIDYIKINDFCYYLFKDSNQNIYIFYENGFSMENRQSDIGYKKFNFKSNTWTKFKSVIKPNNNLTRFVIEIDKNDTIHIVTQRQNGSLYDIYYKSFLNDMLSSPYKVYSTDYPYKIMNLLLINDLIFIFWIWDNTIYYSVSLNQGTTFCYPNKYCFTSSKQLVLLDYISHTLNFDKQIKYIGIPATISNGLKLAFIKSYNEILKKHLPQFETNNEYVSAKNNTQHESLCLPNDYFEKLKDYYDRLVIHLNNLHNNIDKTNIKIKYLEEEVKKINPINNTPKPPTESYNYIYKNSRYRNTNKKFRKKNR